VEAVFRRNGVAVPPTLAVQTVETLGAIVRPPTYHPGHDAIPFRFSQSPSAQIAKPAHGEIIR
jgi:hypothetical protein